MSKSAILPVIEWCVVFESAMPYELWCECSDNNANVVDIEAARVRQELSPDSVSRLANLQRPAHVVVFAEDWSNDVVRHVPVLMRIADETPLVQVRFLFRRSEPEIFARFLTYGTEALPKFVFLNEEFVELGTWGPMPRRCNEVFLRGRASGDTVVALQEIAKLYKADRDKQEVVAELVDALEMACGVGTMAAES